MRQLDEAIQLSRRAIDLDPYVAGFHLNLGKALKDVGRLEQAIAAFETAIALKPDFAEAYINLGSLFISQGRREDACRVYEAAIACLPDRCSFYRLRGFVEPLTRGSILLRRMETLAESAPELPESDQIDLHFGLATAYRDIGEHERSFAHLRAGNTLKRKQVVYDEADTLKWLKRIEGIFSREFLARRRGFGVASEVPVFVIGMPRSGSTLIEQILASHPNVFGGGELTILPHLLSEVSSGTNGGFPEIVSSLSRRQVNRLAERYLETSRVNATDTTRVVDKLLDNFVALGLICLMFPRAKIVHVYRDPLTTCLSCFSHLFKGNDLPYTYDLGELGRFYRAYERLMLHWRSVLPPGTMLDAPYEGLVTDFEPHARRIIEHCGIEWNERCRTYYRTQRDIKTTSALQVRQPIYRTSLNKWSAYVGLAGQLSAALEDRNFEAA